MARFVALRAGHDGTRVIEVGEEFEFAGKPGSWMEPVPVQKKGRKLPAEIAPETDPEIDNP